MELFEEDGRVCGLVLVGGELGMRSIGVGFKEVEMILEVNEFEWDMGIG